jgi:hypothetical protein
MQRPGFVQWRTGSRGSIYGGMTEGRQNSGDLVQMLSFEAPAQRFRPTWLCCFPSPAASSNTHSPSPIGKSLWAATHFCMICGQSARNNPSGLVGGHPTPVASLRRPGFTNIRQILHCSCFLPPRALKRQRTLTRCRCSAHPSRWRGQETCGTAALKPVLRTGLLVQLTRRPRPCKLDLYYFIIYGAARSRSDATCVHDTPIHVLFRDALLVLVH